MSSHVTFIVEKKELLTAFKKIKKIEGDSIRRLSNLEVTIVTDYLNLVITGIQLQIKARTTGSAKFSIPLWYIYDVTSKEKTKEILFIVEENCLKLRGFSFSVQTTFFEDDNILRSINLPINYNYIDLARLFYSGKFTNDELVFNKLELPTYNAVKNVKIDITKVFNIMKNYGYNRKQIENLILNRLKNEDDKGK